MFWMLKGAKPAGMVGSPKEPARVAGLNILSNTSIVPAWKLAAKRKLPDAFCPRASPLYTAPEAELSTARMAWVKSTLGFQPAIVPSSVAKIKKLEPDVVPFVTE